MKKVLLISLILSVGLALFGDFSLNFKDKVTYTDNAFQLSDNDIDKHDDGDDKFSYIETRDDLINTSEASVRYSYKIGKVKYNLSAKGSYTAYIKNSDKSKYMTGAGFGLDYRRFNMGFFYGYYPENYVRKYIDKDGSNEYEKFSYDKNLLKLDAKYRITRKAYVLGYLKYDEYFHNEHFTEYDGNAVTSGIGFKYSLSELYLIGWYYYRNYETDEKISSADAVSDASYESNIFSGELRFKKIKTSSFSYRPVVKLNFEKRYFDGYDKFHSGREDDMLSVNPSIKFYIINNLNITLDYTFKYRNVTSETQSVEDSKSYQENQISLAFEVPIKF